MALIYGPSDTSIPDGYVTPPIFITLPPMVPGNTTTLTYSSTVNGTPAANGWDIRLLDSNGTILASHDRLVIPEGSQSFTFTFTTTEPTPKWGLVVGGGCHGCTLTVHGLEVFTNGTTGSPCAYGTQANPDAVIYETITDALIDLVVAGALAGTGQAQFIPFVETALGALEGSLFFAIDCSTLPQGNNHLDLTNLSTYTPDNLRSWFQYAAWSFFCQCTPAPPLNPPPVPPAAPFVTVPPGLAPVPPPAVCDNTDLCSYLSRIQSEVQTILAQVGYLRQDVTLIQRQAIPFAYIPGTIHSGLSGSGQFAVQGILGISVQLTTMPPGIGEDTAADPLVFFDLGWIAGGTPDGWRQSVRVTHNPMWIPVQPDDTLIGWTFTAGGVATIQEFVREA